MIKWPKQIKNEGWDGTVEDQGISKHSSTLKAKNEIITDRLYTKSKMIGKKIKATKISKQMIKENCTIKLPCIGTMLFLLKLFIYTCLSDI